MRYLLALALLTVPAAPAVAQPSAPYECWLGCEPVEVFASSSSSSGGETAFRLRVEGRDAGFFQGVLGVSGKTVDSVGTGSPTKLVLRPAFAEALRRYPQARVSLPVVQVRTYRWPREKLPLPPGAAEFISEDAVVGQRTVFLSLPKTAVAKPDPPRVLTKKARIRRTGDGRFAVVLKTRGVGKIRLARGGYRATKAKPRTLLRLSAAAANRAAARGSVIAGVVATTSLGKRRVFRVKLTPPPPRQESPPAREKAPATGSSAPSSPVAAPPSPSCDPNYSPCIRYSESDLNCPDIGISVRVIGTDRHGFDRDGDGIGCESY